MTYEVVMTPRAVRSLEKVPRKYHGAIFDFIFGALADNPRRVGGSLTGVFDGSYSARRGSYRILFDIDEDQSTVIVYRISHRSTAYRPPR